MMWWLAVVLRTLSPTPQQKAVIINSPTPYPNSMRANVPGAVILGKNIDAECQFLVGLVKGGQEGAHHH